jgi:hypothetical protein
MTDYDEEDEIASAELIEILVLHELQVSHARPLPSDADLQTYHAAVQEPHIGFGMLGIASDRIDDAGLSAVLTLTLKLPSVSAENGELLGNFCFWLDMATKAWLRSRAPEGTVTSYWNSVP